MTFPVRLHDNFYFEISVVYRRLYTTMMFTVWSLLVHRKPNYKQNIWVVFPRKFLKPHSGLIGSKKLGLGLLRPPDFCNRLTVRKKTG